MYPEERDPIWGATVVDNSIKSYPRTVAGAPRWVSSSPHVGSHHAQSQLTEIGSQEPRDLPSWLCGREGNPDLRSGRVAGRISKFGSCRRRKPTVGYEPWVPPRVEKRAAAIKTKKYIAAPLFSPLGDRVHEPTPPPLRGPFTPSWRVLAHHSRLVRQLFSL